MSLDGNKLPILLRHKVMASIKPPRIVTRAMLTHLRHLRDTLPPVFVGKAEIATVGHFPSSLPHFDARVTSDIQRR